MLAAFEDCLVVVGGWVPDLLLEQADVPQVGSIDVNLALDANKLADGGYADLLKLLLDSGRPPPSRSSRHLPTAGRASSKRQEKNLHAD
jgi:hypothetical protein